MMRPGENSSKTRKAATHTLSSCIGSHVLRTAAHSRFCSMFKRDSRTHPEYERRRDLRCEPGSPPGGRICLLRDCRIRCTGSHSDFDAGALDHRTKEPARIHERSSFRCNERSTRGFNNGLFGFAKFAVGIHLKKQPRSGLTSSWKELRASFRFRSCHEQTRTYRSVSHRRHEPRN
jgi:hypothetical protein